MPKQRMNSADVAAEVACLRQRILGLRLANIYDLNPKVRCWVCGASLVVCLPVCMRHAGTQGRVQAMPRACRARAESRCWGKQCWSMLLAVPLAVVLCALGRVGVGLMA